MITKRACHAYIVTVQSVRQKMPVVCGIQRTARVRKFAVMINNRLD